MVTLSVHFNNGNISEISTASEFVILYEIRFVIVVVPLTDVRLCYVQQASYCMSMDWQ